VAYQSASSPRTKARDESPFIQIRREMDGVDRTIRTTSSSTTSNQRASTRGCMMWYATLSRKRTGHPIGDRSMAGNSTSFTSAERRRADKNGRLDATT